MYFRTKYKYIAKLCHKSKSVYTPLNFMSNLLSTMVVENDDNVIYCDYVVLFNNKPIYNYDVDRYYLKSILRYYEEFLKPRLLDVIEKLVDIRGFNFDCYSNCIQIYIRFRVLFINRVKYGSSGGIPFQRVDGKGDTYEEDGVFCYS